MTSKWQKHITKLPKYKLKLKRNLKIKAYLKNILKSGYTNWKHLYLAVQNNSAIPPHQPNFNQIIELLSFSCISLVLKIYYKILFNNRLYNNILDNILD